MADLISNMLAQYAGQGVSPPPVEQQDIQAADAIFDPKKSAVAAAAYEKKAELNAKGYRGAAADDTGLGTATPTNPLLAPYDPEANAAETAGAGAYWDDASAERTGLQATGDAVNEALSAGLMGPAEIANIPISAVNANAGSMVSKFIQDGLNNAQAKKSDSSQAHNRAYNERTNVTEDNNARIYDKEKGSYGDTVASFRRIGRDVISGITNMDSSNITDIASNGIGSLLTAGPEGRVLEAARAGRFAMPMAIGLQEAGGAHHQAFQDVLGMSHEQLAAGSEKYKNLVAHGMSPDDARIAVARDVALETAAIQGPAAAVTGLLTAKFEAHPFRVGKVGEAIGNLLTEGVEEGSQSASQSLAENKATQDFADSSRELAAGVGTNIAQGIVGGIGSAALTETPTLALKGAVAAAMVPVRLVKAALARGQKISDKTVQAATEKYDVALDTASQVVASPENKQNIEEAVTSKAADETQANEATNYINQILDQVSPEKVTQLRQAVDIAKNTEASEDDRYHAALDILDMAQESNVIAHQDMPAAIQTLIEEDPQNPARQQIEDVQKLLSELHSHPEVQNALKIVGERQAQSSEDAAPTDQVPDEQTINNAVRAAQHVPEQANPDLTNKILFHADNGNIQLQLEQRKVLEISKNLQTITQDRIARAQKLGLKSADQVSNEIILSQDEGAPNNGLSSATDYYKAVTSAIKSGNTEKAKLYLNDMMLFAQHMGNKVQAINEALSNGGGKENQAHYQSLHPTRRLFLKSEKPIGVTPTSVGSVRFAQRVANDTSTVHALANTLASTFPELGVKELPAINLDARLDGPAHEVVNNFKAQTTKTQEPAKASTTEPEATGQPEGGDLSVEAKVEQPVVKEPAPAKAEAAVEEIKSEEPKAAEKPVVQEPIQTEGEHAAPVSDLIAEAVSKEAPAVAQPEPQAKVEAEAEPTEVKAEAKPAKPTIKSTFSKLLPSSWFLKHFTLQENKSRLTDKELPIKNMMDALSSQENAEAFAGHKLNREITRSISKGYGELFGMARNIYKILDGRLQAALSEKSGNKTIQELLVNGNDKGSAPNTWRSHKVLNLVEQTEDGKLEYNQNLFQGAILAGLNWALTAGKQGRNYSDEDISEILSIDSNDVTDAHRNFFRNSTYLSDSVDSLVSNINRFWGVQAKKSAPIGQSVAVTEAIAKEILVGLQEAGLVDISTETFEDESGHPNTYISVKVNVPKNISDSVAAYPDALEDLISVEPEKTHYVGTAPTKVQEYIGSDYIVQVTDQQKEMIREAQNTPHYLNTKMLKFLTDLGKDLTVKLFGLDAENSDLNINHRKSMEGFNLTVTGAFDYVRDIAQQVSNAAKATGTELDQVPVYHQYEVSKVNRLHAQGSYNPQANKLVREVQAPTRSTLDLSNENGKGFSVFLLAMAQHWGIKVHKEARADVIGKALQRAKNDYAQSIDLLRNWNKNNAKLTENDVATLAQEFGNDLTPGAIHAAVEYARWLDSTPEERANFTTSLYVEADGVTDGPVNALMHLSTGEFTPRWLKMIAKGGLFIGSKAMALSDYIQSSKEAAQDLYETTSINVREYLQAALNTATGPMATQRRALLYAMTELMGGDVQFDLTANEITDLKRGIAKNPLTVTVYGSGNTGIANKIANEMLIKVYEQYSAGNPSPKLLEALNLLTDNKIVKDRKGNLFVKSDPQTNSSTSPKDYKITSGEFRNLQQNILHLFVMPLQGGIDEVMGSVNVARDNLRRAEQIKSIVIAHAFRTEVQAAIAARKAEDPSWSTHHALSQQELDQINAKMAKQFHGIISTPTQNFYPAAVEKADISDPTSDDLKDDKKRKNAKRPIEISRTLDDKLSTPLRISGPGNAGVRGIPYIVIGSGDGQMIQNVATAANAPQGALYVFDGINLKLSTAEEDSQNINQAVLQGWIGNPLQAVADAYNGFLGALGDTIGNLSQSELNDLAASIYGLGETAEGLTPDVMLKDMQQIGEDLNQHAKDSAARKEALSKVNLSVDHMASTESPHVQDGLTVDGSFEEISDQLNKLMHGNTKTEVNQPKVFKSSKLSINFDSFSKDQQIIASAALKALGKSHTIVMGSLEEIKNYLGSNIPEGLNEKTNGFYLPGTQTIFIINNSPEVMTHELIHAATFAKVNAYYEGNITDEEATAVKRLEQLMHEWLQSDETNPNAVSEVQKHLNINERALAVNEFMAWVLGNSELTNQAKEIKVSKLSELKTKVINSLKRLFGIKVGVGNDLFSNLRFNTMILMRTQPTLSERLANVALYHSTYFGSDPRLTDIKKKLGLIIGSMVRNEPNPVIKENLKVAVQKAVTDAVSIANDFQAQGFSMTPQEASTFRMVVQTLATEAQLDPNTMLRVQDLYDHVVKKLTVEDFMSDPLDDAQRYTAQNKFNAIVDNHLIKNDVAGRTSLLPAFLGLATTNTEFRNILKQMIVPKAEKNKGRTFDEKLENLTNFALDKLSAVLAGEGRNAPNIAAAIDNMMQQLTDSVDDQENMISGMMGAVGNYVDRANQIIVDTKDEWADKTADAMQTLEDRTNNKYAKGVFRAGQLIASFVNEERAQKVQMGVMHLLNEGKVWKPIHDLFNEIIGRTEENAPIYDMVKLVRAFIQQVRQQYREKLPPKLAEKYSRKLETEEWTQLFHGLGKTDIAALRDGYTMPQIMNLLKNPTNIGNEISRIEERLQRDQPAHWPLFEQKAKDLATYMVTGKVTTDNLLRNANAIAHLYGEGSPRSRPNATNAVIRSLDHLTTLYAYQMTSKETQDKISDLVQNELKGIDFTLSYLIGRRNSELEKVAASTQAEANHFKGFVPSEARSGVSMIIANDSEEGRLKLLGFQRVKAYNGSAAERGAPRKSYFYAPLSGRSPFSQGIIQNVRATASGVDPRTGFTLGTTTAGVITDPYTVEQINRARRLNTNTDEALMPVYDQSGTVLAWERAIDPNEDLKLERNTNLSEVLGVWAGRQVEEAAANEFNNQLINHLSKMWNSEDAGSRVEYINVFDPRELRKDKVLADAVRLITPDTRTAIEAAFEEGEFWVRKDMLNDALGYRAASVGDAWTGVSRLHPEFSKNIRNITTSVFGADAYKYMVTAEKFWQNFVADARTTIVVKSIIVAGSNMLSNVQHLIAVSVPMTDIMKGIPRKTAEINSYTRTKLREIDLQAELEVANAANDVVAQRRAKTEIQAIHDNWKRLSIWPLLEAGEFSAISDVGIGQEDIALSEGKLTGYIENLVSKLPESVRTAGRYAIISKDTALFKGLEKAVTYGDFLGKAIMYDDLVKRQKKSKEYALGRISEEFINFDRLAGRSRSYLENMGLLWFWNFKLRAAKVAATTIRNNPLHALLSNFVPMPTIFGSVGTPIGDNFVSIAAEGKLGWSIGPSQAFRAYSLSPVWNLFN